MIVRDSPSRNSAERHNSATRCSEPGARPPRCDETACGPVSPAHSGTPTVTASRSRSCLRLDPARKGARGLRILGAGRPLAEGRFGSAHPAPASTGLRSSWTSRCGRCPHTPSGPGGCVAADDTPVARGRPPPPCCRTRRRERRFGSWGTLVGAAGLTLARVLLATVLGTLWTVPVGLAIGLSPRLSPAAARRAGRRLVPGTDALRAGSASQTQTPFDRMVRMVKAPRCSTSSTPRTGSSS